MQLQTKIAPPTQAQTQTRTNKIKRDIFKGNELYLRASNIFILSLSLFLSPTFYENV